MARPLRIEFAGANHHVMSRGDARRCTSATRSEPAQRLGRTPLAKSVDSLLRRFDAELTKNVSLQEDVGMLEARLRKTENRV